MFQCINVPEHQHSIRSTHSVLILHTFIDMRSFIRQTTHWLGCKVHLKVQMQQPMYFAHNFILVMVSKYCLYVLYIYLPVCWPTNVSCMYVYILYTEQCRDLQTHKAFTMMFQRSGHLLYAVYIICLGIETRIRCCTPLQVQGMGYMQLCNDMQIVEQQSIFLQSE